MVHFREVENDRRAGNCGQNEDACLERIIEGQKIYQKITEQRIDDQFQSADQVDNGAGKQIFEGYGRKPYSENDHAKRRRHAAEQGDRARKNFGQIILPPEEVKGQSKHKSERGRVKHGRLKGHIFLIVRQAEYAHRKYENVHGKNVYRGIAQNFGVVGEQGFYDRQSEKTDVSENGADRQNTVTAVRIFFSAYEVEDQHEHDLQNERYKKEERHLTEAVPGKVELQKGIYNHARRAYVDEYGGHCGKMFRRGFFHFADNEPRKDKKERQ